MKTNAYVRYDDLPLETRSGRKAAVEFISNVYQAGGVEVVQCNIRDNSARRESSEALRASEERYRQLVETSHDLIWEMGANGRILFINHAALEIFGYEPQEMIGRLFFDFIPEEVRQRYAGKLTERLATDVEILRDESDVYRKDGSLVTLHTNARVIRDERGQVLGLSGSSRDITDMKAAEREELILRKRLEQGERVATLGRVAATMAHEFNNVLMSILPFADIVAREGKTSQKLSLSAHHIHKAVARGKEITSEVLRFTNPVRPTLKPIELLSWLPELRREITTVLASRYVIELRLPSAPLTIVGDPLQLEQVFINLAFNARDAMPEGGRLIISADPSPAEQEYATTQLPRASDFIHILVKDEGVGIPPETLEHVFEPLFTTKKTGTGIGLGVAHQTLLLHGGSITVESQVGIGTTFHLFFPMKSGATVPAPSTFSDGEKIAVAGSLEHRRILLVEDEPLVAAGIAAGLEVVNATVHVVGEGKLVMEAIRSFKPDVVILDIMLSDIDGRLVQKEVAALWPQLPVILSSGVIDEASLGREVAGCVAYLQKPYSTAALHDLLIGLIVKCDAGG